MSMLRTMVLTLGACTLLRAPTGAAQPAATLWQIGQEDHSYSEFALVGDYPSFNQRFSNAPAFVIGKSDPKRDWPFIQPGPVDSWAGHQEHPLTVDFELAAEPRGVFILRVALVDAHAGAPPSLRIAVNGRLGTFPLEPGGGDGSLTDPTRGKAQRLEVLIPASYLQRGSNRIVFTAVQGSWLEWDAVGLLHDPQADTTNPQIRSIQVEATPLVLRNANQPRRVIEVRTQLSAPAAEVVIEVQAGGETIAARASGLFGSDGLRKELAIPASMGTTEVAVTVTAGASRQTETIRLAPAIPWKVFIAASAHTDVGYTDLQPRCAERHNQNTDTALDLMDRYPGFKWNLEVAWQAENYLAARPENRREQFIRRAREGRLGVQSLYGNFLTGLWSHEGACRLTRFAHGLEKAYGIPDRSAMISDVPSQEASLPMLLAGAGIRYFSSGINNDRAYPFTVMPNQSPCWWEGPDGSRVLMHYATSYAQASGWGLDTSLEAAAARLTQQLKTYEARSNYPYDAVFLHGALGDNSPLTARLAEVVQEWNARYASPQLILAHNAEFFEYIEKNYSDKLPVVHGSAGSYWEDGAGSSARETTLCRRAQESLATAGKLCAFATQIDRGQPYPREALETAWRHCLLYDEHTWGAHCSISQPESEFSKEQWRIKAQFAIDADREAADLLNQAAAGFASLIHTDGAALVVMNAANWPRTDVVRTRLPDGTEVADPSIVSCDDGGESLLLVPDVPAGGYRVIPLRPGRQRETAREAPGHEIESPFYRVTFHPTTGAITSLFDKLAGRELTDTNAADSLNQYLYVSGGEGSRIVMNPQGPEPSLTVHRPASAQLQRVRLGDLGERMVVESSAEMAPRLRSEITVWNHLRRVDFANRLAKTRTYRKEAVYFAFPFAAEQPTIRYECPAGIVIANTGMLPGACLDWFAVQHFVELADKDIAITWTTPDAPLVCLQDINRGQWRRQLPIVTGHLYSYAMNNYWHTNYKPGQGGEHQFHFSVSSRRQEDQAASARFGWEAANPLVLAAVGKATTGPLTAPAASLIDVAEPNVLLIGGKQADVGSGIILRLWEVSGRSGNATVRLRQLPAAKAVLCNLVEETERELPVKDGVVSVPLRGYGLATLRLER